MTHEIVKTENYLLVVDDSEIKVNDFYYDSNDKESITPIYRRSQDPKFYTGCKKIIAHLPLHNAPFLEGVDVLPPLEEDDVEKMADETYPKTYYSGIYVDGWLKAGFIKGYNKAREKYRYTEEDMRKAFIEGANYGSAYQSCIENEDWKAVKEMDKYDDDTIKEIIQSLSQPKMPTHFEVFYDIDTLDSEGKVYQMTTTNNLGQTQWVGKYIYA